MRLNHPTYGYAICSLGEPMPIKGFILSDDSEAWLTIDQAERIAVIGTDYNIQIVINMHKKMFYAVLHNTGSIVQLMTFTVIEYTGNKDPSDHYVFMSPFEIEKLMHK